MSGKNRSLKYFFDVREKTKKIQTRRVRPKSFEKKTKNGKIALEKSCNVTF